MTSTTTSPFFSRTTSLEQIAMLADPQPPTTTTSSNSSAGNPDSIDLQKVWAAGQLAYQELQKLKQDFETAKTAHKTKSTANPTGSVVDGMGKPVFSNGGVIAQSTGTGLTAGGILYTFSKLDIWVQIAIVAGISFMALGAICTSLYHRHRKVTKANDQESKTSTTLSKEVEICQNISNTAQNILQSTTIQELNQNLSSLNTLCGTQTHRLVTKNFSYEIGLLQGKYKGDIDKNVTDPIAFSAFKSEVLSKIINPLTSELALLKGNYEVTSLPSQPANTLTEIKVE